MKRVFVRSIATRRGKVLADGPTKSAPQSPPRCGGPNLGMPLGNVDAMRQAYFGAVIVFSSKRRATRASARDPVDRSGCADHWVRCRTAEVPLRADTGCVLSDAGGAALRCRLM